jgi:Dyp-type peroxidase family
MRSSVNQQVLELSPDVATLELADIQSLVLYPVAFPYARFAFFHVGDAAAGRRFVAALAEMVTSALHPGGAMAPAKEHEVSVGFTYAGLVALDLPARTLCSFPVDFTQGMERRARELLVDRGPSDPDTWEQPYRGDRIHIWVGMQAHGAQPAAGDSGATTGQQGVDTLHQRVLAAAAAAGAIEQVGTQDAGALFIDGKPTDREHFGYRDGFGNPDIAGDGWAASRGSGKADGKGDWTPLAPGEFILGQPNEAGELPAAPVPDGIARNGTFMAFRKLHENVGAFRQWLHEESARAGIPPALLAAKLVGRFQDGTPLSLRDEPYPADVWAQMAADPRFMDRLTDFTYAADGEGMRCPMGSHIRRMNPRDSLGFDGVLVNQRRIIRRGLPYGEWVPESTPLDEVHASDACDADVPSHHGVLFMALNASLERQFEFVQREWMNYGNDFRQGNDRDPLLGNRDGESRMVIQGSPEGPVRRPHLCASLPQFVTTRGGIYVFIPGIAALRAIGAGAIEYA